MCVCFAESEQTKTKRPIKDGSVDAIHLLHSKHMSHVSSFFLFLFGNSIRIQNGAERCTLFCVGISYTHPTKIRFHFVFGTHHCRMNLSICSAYDVDECTTIFHDGGDLFRVTRSRFQIINWNLFIILYDFKLPYGLIKCWKKNARLLFKLVRVLCAALK